MAPGLLASCFTRLAWIRCPLGNLFFFVFSTFIGLSVMIVFSATEILLKLEWSRIYALNRFIVRFPDNN
jgi:hypothetical protein